MKLKKLTFIVISATLLLSCSQEKIVELPLTAQTGYGHFPVGMEGISPISKDENNPWKNTYLKVSKLPEGLTDLKYGNIETNIYQSVYQDYLAGNITKDWYEKLQKSWDWTPDSLNLSKNPVKTKIAFAYGKDSEGVLKIAIDVNNNLDLSDDQLFTPLYFEDNQSKQDSLAQIHALPVSFEIYTQNKIIPVNIPLFVMYSRQINCFLCNFSQYATTSYKGEQIAVCSGNFTNVSYNSIQIALTNENLEPDYKFGEDELYRQNTYLEIKGEIYKILGVNTNKNTLVLEKTDLPKNQLISTQTGYKPCPFEGKDFKTQSAISLEKLKGKYVLLDFWAVWCGPCIQEIPALKELYAKIDKSKFEIVGIVGQSPSDALNDLIDRHSILWPQILSDDTNKIIENYGINAYPTTFLLDANGIIIAKNLSAKDAEEKLLSLIEK
jgi:peroxiredoxin